MRWTTPIVDEETVVGLVRDPGCGVGTALQLHRADENRVRNFADVENMETFESFRDRLAVTRQACARR